MDKHTRISETKMPDLGDVRIWAVVPAAGMSRRMGHSKQTLRVGGATMTGAVVDTLLMTDVVRVVVVTRGDLRDKLELPGDRRVAVALNDDPDSQMIDSIRIGLSAVDRWEPGQRDGVLVVPGDMPRIALDTYRACAAAFRDDPERIVIAVRGARRGHPVIFPWALRTELEQLQDGLRELHVRHPDCVYELRTQDEGVTHDVDTPDDYRLI